MVLSRNLCKIYRNFKDADCENISRVRGGIIAATINKIDKYENATSYNAH